MIYLRITIMGTKKFIDLDLERELVENYINTYHSNSSIYSYFDLDFFAGHLMGKKCIEQARQLMSWITSNSSNYVYSLEILTSKY